MGAWVIAIPVSVWTSRVETGTALRRAGLLLTPEEVAPPLLLNEFHAIQRNLASEVRESSSGFIAAVVDPGVNALHCALLRDHAGSISEEVAMSRRRLMLDALKQGPEALDRRERMMLLADGEALTELHWAVWSLREELARRWRPVITEEAG